MSQQEFEPQGQQFGEEIYQPQYPYAWSDQEQQQGMPRDEPPSSHSTQSGWSGTQDYQPGQAQVPWWARLQAQQNGPLVFAALVALVIFLTLVTGALGIASFVPGGPGYILGLVWGAILALLVFVFLLLFLILRLVLRTVRRGRHPL